MEMFLALEELADEGALGDREAALARVAACFHDAVYDPAALPGANEADSAELAVRDLRALGVRDDDVGAVRHLVLATERHTHPATRGSALRSTTPTCGSSRPRRSGSTSTAPRSGAEYAAVPDDAFAAGRTRVLQPFLRRDTVYATRHARRAWNDRARLNLARELSRLSG